MDMASTRKVQKTVNDQYVVTIPKALAEALGFKQGTRLEFKLNEKGEVVIKKVRKK